MWGRTLGCAAHFLLGDPAQLVHEVAVERALAAVYVPTHHNTHVGLGISSSGSSIIEGQVSHAITISLPVKDVELVARSRS